MNTLLPTFTQKNWIHKTVINYTDLQSGSPDVSVPSLSIGTVTSSTFKYLVIQSNQDDYFKGATVSVDSGTGASQTRVVTAYNGTSGVFSISPAWTTTPDGTSSISLSRYNSYKDIILFGLPANYLITGVKVATLTSFNAGLNNNVFVYVANSNVIRVLDASPNLLTDVHKCYGMGVLTIPSGSGDSYEYGSFRWFSLSSPGASTYDRASILPGNPTAGAYCQPQRFDAHDVIGRFCILSNSDTPATPILDTNLSFNGSVTTGAVEISIVYTSI